MGLSWAGWFGGVRGREREKQKHYFKDIRWIRYRRTACTVKP